MKESKYQSIVVKELRGLGAVVLNKLGTGYEGRGWPDLYVGWKGCQFWIELKTGSRLSEVQKSRISVMRREGIPVFVLRGRVRNEELVETLEYGDEGQVVCRGVQRVDHKRGLVRLKKLQEIIESGQHMEAAGGR